MVKVSLRTVKSKTGFQSFILAISYDIVRWSRIRKLIIPLSRYLKRIGGMQSTQKYSRISSWLQHIPIYNFPPLWWGRKKTENESLLRKSPAPLNGRNAGILYDNLNPHSARLTQEKYFIWASLFYSINYIHQIFHRVQLICDAVLFQL